MEKTWISKCFFHPCINLTRRNRPGRYLRVQVKVMLKVGLRVSGFSVWEVGKEQFFEGGLTGGFKDFLKCLHYKLEFGR